MRLRKIAGADEKTAAHSRVLKTREEPEAVKERLTGLAAEKELYLEIGMGKGDFILGMAAKYPERLFLGMERYSSVLIKALEKYDKLEQRPENLVFLWEDAIRLAEFLGRSSLAGIYLNFSDPWPKERYAKRRLTAPKFLEVYAEILKPDAVLEFKTDNEELFHYSIDSISQNTVFEMERLFWDLHREILPQDNVMTEYEKKFSQKGQPIYKLIARCRKSS